MVAEQTNSPSNPGPPMMLSRYPGQLHPIMRAIAWRPRTKHFAAAAARMGWPRRVVPVFGSHCWAHDGIVVARCPLPEAPPIDVSGPPVQFTQLPWVGPVSSTFDIRNVDLTREPRWKIPTCVVLPGIREWGINRDVANTLREHGVGSLSIVWSAAPALRADGMGEVRALVIPFMRFAVDEVEGIVVPASLGLRDERDQEAGD